MKKPFSTYGIGIALTGVLLSAAGIWAVAAPPEMTAEQDLASQISADVQTALQKNQEAGSAEEWVTSGYTGADIFKNVNDLGKRWPEAWADLCNQLQQLSSDDLVLFESEIENPEFAKKLPCATRLQRKVQRYWQNTEVALAAYENEVSTLAQDSETKDGEKQPEAAELETIEKVIDPSEGGIYYRGDLGPKEVALTFDDGPHPTRTALILKTLRDAGVKATFFELGENVKSHPSIPKEVLADGHTIGSHTVHHPLMTRLVRSSLAEAEDEIVQGQQLVENTIGIPAPFFRFPYGAGTKTLRTFVKEKNMATFHWNIDSQDWKIRNAKLLYKRILRVLKEENESGIILFHDIQKQTTIVLPLVLKHLKENGYKTVVFVPKK